MKNRGIKKRIPWWAKMSTKLILCSLPAGYRFWRSLAVFRHGGMERPDWAYSTFRRHYDGVEFARKGRGFTLLELGPGDSLVSALIAHAHGAMRSILVDVAPFANQDPAIYRRMAAYLAERGLPIPAMSATATLADYLSACGARYETSGLTSLRGVPAASVDFCFSNSVLQHVRRSEFSATIRELRRVMRPDAISIHSIDLRDMMGAGLDHLRFTERFWESNLVGRAGYYSNRFRFAEMLDEFREAGFDPEPTEINRWASPPIDRTSLASCFRRYTDDDLRVATFNVVLHPR
jgi:hypothetical protein